MSNFITGLGGITDFFPIDCIDWSTNPQKQVLQARAIFGFSGTIREYIVYTDLRPVKPSFQLKLFSKEEEYNLIDFFNNMQGQIGIFWFASPESLFELAENISNGSNQFVIKQCRASFYGHERVYLTLKNGDLLTFEVGSIEETLGEEKQIINTVENIDRTLQPDEVEFFSVLYLCRFNFDRLEIRQVTDLYSTVNIDLLEVIREYP